MTGNDIIQIKILFTHSNIALKNMGENEISSLGIPEKANVIHVSSTYIRCNLLPCIR